MTAFPSSAPTTARPAVAAARATDLTKVYGQGETQVVALDSVSRVPADRIHSNHGTFGIRQVHAHALHGRTRQWHCPDRDA
ncbi:hypothetical protein GCM10010390_14860 [Streptomyces mordarskii]|uniref:Uncharacterized protein n=1 Tax=Streptomyces mordarskii TaxID=1226758 RepID=A0ABP3M6D8_9ACTN